MRIRIIETDAVVEYEDEYALRLIEQGRAEKYDGESVGDAGIMFETGAFICPYDFNGYTEELRCHLFTGKEAALAWLESIGYKTNTKCLIYNAVNGYFSQKPAPGRVIISFCPWTETGAEAIAALLAIRDDFYGMVVPISSDVSPNTEQHAAHINFIKSIVSYITDNHMAKMMFGVVGSWVDYAPDDPSGLAKYYFDHPNDHVMAIVGNTIGAGMCMGTAMGLRHANGDKWFTLKGKGSNGSMFSEEKIVQCNRVNGNLMIYATLTNGTAIFSIFYRGVVSSGKQYEDVLAADLAAAGLKVPVKDEEAWEEYSTMIEQYVQLYARLRTLVYA